MNVIVTELSGNAIEHMQKTIPTIASR